MVKLYVNCLGNLYSTENWYGFAELTTLITIEENGVRLYTPAEYEEEEEVEEFLTFEEFLKRG